MAAAYGFFWLSAVLGWSALFAGGSSVVARAVQFLWLALLISLAAFFSNAWAVSAGAAAGALGHLLLLSGLKGRHA